MTCSNKKNSIKTSFETIHQPLIVPPQAQQQNLLVRQPMPVPKTNPDYEKQVLAAYNKLKKRPL